MTRIKITPEEVDRLGDLREYKATIEKEIATLTGIMVKSGWETLQGTKYRAVVVEKELSIVLAKDLRAKAEEDSVFHKLVRRFLGTRLQMEVRTFYVGRDKLSA